jgi:hypothetical protein
MYVYNYQYYLMVSNNNDDFIVEGTLFSRLKAFILFNEGRLTKFTDCEFFDITIQEYG